MTPPGNNVVTKDVRSIRPKIDAAIPEKAMVLAAGLGTRMAPLTETTPKPLIKVAGKTMLDRALDHLAAAGVKQAVVNVHHKAGQVRAHLEAREGGPKVEISDESETRLETGGGVKKALPLLGGAPFYIVNSDIIWRDGLTDTLKELALYWDPEKMDALLLMVRAASAIGYDGRGDYMMDMFGRLASPDERCVAPFVFGGVQILNPKLFEDAPEGAFSLKKLFDKAEANGRLYGIVHGGQWMHVGAPDAIAVAEEALAE